MGRPRRMIGTLIMSDETSGDRPHVLPVTGPVREPSRNLTFGRSGPRLDSPKDRPGPDNPAHREAIDLTSLASRCRAKAEAARWAAERQRHERSESADEEAPSDPAMVKWAETLTDAAARRPNGR